MSSLQFLSSVLTQLEQEFGEPLSILVTDSETLDPVSGVLAKITTEHKIKRAVEVPVGSGRKFAYDIAFLAANKNFTYGGNFDVYEKEILIRSKYVPRTYVPKFDNFIKFRDKLYRITKIDELAQRQGWVFKIKHVENTPDES